MSPPPGAKSIAAPRSGLTAKDTRPDRITGFRAGDDYLTKPLALAEMLVRVHALLRHAVAAG